ncbi:hypothetical protein Pint_08376 [Pistacia integerrima]|uniref:Uncharacterized protein n=1 Tax=Pistacia integerrima TaxID=434235 RepID=A0ACC0XVU4_9ROSI|nr:hypothetical protein Pint_08376 [Pistacia integerrima]
MAWTIKEAIEEFFDHLRILLSAFLECIPQANWGDLKRLDLAALLQKTVDERAQVCSS